MGYFNRNNRRYRRRRNTLYNKTAFQSLVFGVLIIGVGIGTYLWGRSIGKEKGFAEYYLNTTDKFISNEFLSTIEFKDVELEMNYNLIARKVIQSSTLDSEESQELFSQALSLVHKEVLRESFQAAEIDGRTSRELLKTYDEIHDVIVDKYQLRFNNQIKNIKITEDPFYEQRAYNLADEFSITVSSGICELVSTIATVVIMKGKGKVTIKSVASGIEKGIEVQSILSNICTPILNTVMPQLNQSLQEAGILIDLQSIEITVDDRFRKSIAEIATVEEILKDINVVKTVERTPTIFGTNINWAKSTATVEINSGARVKAGIDVNKYLDYNLNSQNRELSIITAEPEILSIEIFPEVARIENGVMIKVTNELMNQAIDDVRLKVRQISKDDAIFDQAKVNFEQFFKVVILPAIRSRGVESVKFQYLSKKEITKGTRSYQIKN